MYQIQFYLDDDPLHVATMCRYVPAIGAGITFEHPTRKAPPTRYRVVDVDHGYVERGTGAGEYKESTVAVYLIGADDPRRVAYLPDSDPRSQK